jgi:hypothetical protein
MVLTTPAMVAVCFLPEPFSSPGLEVRVKGTMRGLDEQSKL